MIAQREHAAAAALEKLDARHLGEPGACGPEQGHRRARAGRRHAGRLHGRHAGSLPAAAAAARSRAATVPRDRAAVVLARAEPQPGVLSVLLHPRAFRALPDNGARSRRALLVLHPDPAGRAAAGDRQLAQLDAGAISKASAAPGEFRAGAVPAHLVRGRRRVVLALTVEARLLRDAGHAAAGRGAGASHARRKPTPSRAPNGSRSASCCSSPRAW